MSRNSRRSREERARMEMIAPDAGRKPDSALRRGVFLVPATITSIGLLSGFYSMVSAVNGHFEVAAVMIVIAFVCDGLDGRIARASRTSSQFGVEYDSLSDVIAFGVAAIVKSGGKELAMELEAKGYDWIKAIDASTVSAQQLG